MKQNNTMTNGKKMYRTMRLPSIMLFVWLRGLIDSLSGKADYVDEVLAGGYLTRLTNRYEAYAADVISQMNNTVIALAKRAEVIFVRLSELNVSEEPEPSDDYDFMRDESLSLVERQRMYKNRVTVKKRNKEIKEERSACVRELVLLRREINQTEEKTSFWLLKTAERVNSVVTSYANGVRVKKPVRRVMLPCVNTDTLAKALYDTYDPITQNTIARMDEIIIRESS